MPAGRPTPAALLAALYAVSGALCCVGALWPMSDQTPVTLLWVLGAVGLLCGVGFWLLGSRLPAAAVHGAIGAMSLLIGVLAWQSATQVGIVGLGPVLIAVGLYAAHFFTLRAARLHVLALVVAASLGAFAAQPDGFLVPWVVLVVSTIALTDLQARLALHLRTAAATDPLTGVANRRAWEAEAARNLAHAARTGEPLSFAILDLDDFKEVNDRLGHGAGDDLLRDLTHGWMRRLRTADLLGRYGGDEFVLCLPATDRKGAAEILERLVASHEFAWSGGIATAEAGDTLTTVLARADADLYRQKRSNRGV
jgi:diguanylate cyclase (GGDEF)-like protein